MELENPGDQTEGIVVSVEPSGTLEEGDEVSVSFYGKAPKGPPETPPGQEKDKKGSETG